MTERIYLDHNATTPVRPEAAAAVSAALAEPGNPSSVHADGRRARRIVEEAREAVAALVNAPPSGVFFTGGGTEADALALAAGRDRIIVTTAIEHDAVLANLPGDAVVVPVKANGQADPGGIEAVLAGLGRPALVSVMLANNETGVLQPVAEIAAIASRYDALTHTDAIQAAGKVPVDMAALGVDLMSLSAHKLGGPKGVGALVAKPGLDLHPLYRGGGQERRLRPGTENVPGIAGFGAAVSASSAGLGAFAGLARLRDRLEAGVRDSAADVRFYGQDVPRLPNTSCFSAPGLKAETALMQFDLAGISVGSGSACSSGKVTPSHVLTAMGASADEAAGALRISLGWPTKEADIDAFLDVWRQICRRRAAA